jgi:hypothetical protein
MIFAVYIVLNPPYMKIKTLFIIVMLMVLAVAGCKKDSTDLASKIAGTYSGNFSFEINLLPGTAQLIRQSESLVTIRETYKGSSPFDIINVNVTDGGNGIVLLQRSADSIHVSGKVDGNKLDYSMPVIDFSGTK